MAPHREICSPLDGKIFKNGIAFGNYLRKINKTVREVYDEFLKTEKEGSCQVCKKETSFISFSKGYRNFCSDICAMKSEKHRSSVSQRFFGNPDKLKEALRKTKIAVNSQSIEKKTEIQKKKHDSKVKKYGEKYASEQSLVQWSKKTEEERKNIGKRIVETRIKNGTLVTSPSNFKMKEVVIGGKKYHYQGYEGIVLNLLIEELKLDPKLVINGRDIKPVPFCGNRSGKYRPDIWIPNFNLLIEVKSQYTFCKYPDVYLKNLQKQKASFDAGYFHVFFVLYNGKISNSCKIAMKEILDMTISSQAQEIEKVQRLEVDTSYSPIAIGTGSALRPNWVVI